ncbi:MAG: dihydroorotate dehydrogenase, partial [Smithella sp.]
MAVNIAGMKMKNPVMTASGTFGCGEEYADYVDLTRLGGIVVKGLSLKPRLGNAPPRIMETAAGMLNAVGLQNIGVDAFIEEKLPFLQQYRVAVIANIYGESYKEYAQVAGKLSKAG